MADKKKDVYDADIVALIENRSEHIADRWQLMSFHTSAGSGAVPTATLELKCQDEDETFCDAATGDGPIDAIFQALERIIGVTARLQDYQVHSVSGGKDAQGEVHVEISVNGRTYHGKGVSTDIIEASAHAYLKALNKSLVDPSRATDPANETVTHGV